MRACALSGCHEVTTYARRGLGMAAQLLCDGRVVVIFPEGYPAVDPTPGVRQPVRHADSILPFSRGVTTIARLASRAGCAAPILPVGFVYERQGGRWRIHARIGEPLPNDAGISDLETHVRALSENPVRADRAVVALASPCPANVRKHELPGSAAPRSRTD